MYKRTLPNAQERELAANFYYEVLPKAAVIWVQTGIETLESRVDEDVTELAQMLAEYRFTLGRQTEQPRDRRRSY